MEMREDSLKKVNLMFNSLFDVVGIHGPEFSLTSHTHQPPPPDIKYEGMRKKKEGRIKGLR